MSVTTPMGASSRHLSGRGLAASALSLALIHPSAWNRCSRKFVYEILHTRTPLPPKSPAPDTLHSPGPLPLVTPMDRYARLWMRS
jgi:hypothetical protein